MDSFVLTYLPSLAAERLGSTFQYRDFFPDLMKGFKRKSLRFV